MLLALLLAGSARGDTTACVSNAGNVVFQASSTLNIELIGTTRCSGYDSYTVGQTLTLQGATLNVTLGNGFVPAAGQSFQILSWKTLSGTFGTLNLPPLGAGSAWNTGALYTTGTISVTGPVVTGGAATDGPLPPWSFVALGAGFLGIAQRRLRANRCIRGASRDRAPDSPSTT